MGVKVNQHFPWLFDLLDRIPFPIAKNIMPPGALDMVAFTDVSIASNNLLCIVF